LPEKVNGQVSQWHERSARLLSPGRGGHHPDWQTAT